VSCSHFHAQFTGLYDQEIARIAIVICACDDDDDEHDNNGGNEDILFEINSHDCPMILQQGWVKFLHQNEQDQHEPRVATTKPSALILSKLVQQLSNQQQRRPGLSSQQPLYKKKRIIFAMRYLLYNVNDSLVGEAHAHLFLWKSHYQIVVCDIDGTITRSNVQGVMDTILTENYKKVLPNSMKQDQNKRSTTNPSCCHDGICQFLSQLVVHQQNDIMERGCDDEEDQEIVQVVYLTARPIALASITRSFLQHVRQPGIAPTTVVATATTPATTAGARLMTGARIAPLPLVQDDDNHDRSYYSLPHGPLLMYLGSIPQMLFMELVTRTVHQAKAQLLWDNVVEPFQSPPSPTTSGGTGENGTTRSIQHQRIRRRRGQFIAGFGNSMSDAMAYHMVGIPLGHIYMLNPTSHIGCFASSSHQENEHDDDENYDDMDVDHAAHANDEEDLQPLITPLATPVVMGGVHGGGSGKNTIVPRDVLLVAPPPPTTAASASSTTTRPRSINSSSSHGSYQHQQQQQPSRPMEWYQQKLKIMYHSFHDEQLHSRVKERPHVMK
jgi:hypothetical protein